MDVPARQPRCCTFWLPVQQPPGCSGRRDNMWDRNKLNREENSRSRRLPAPNVCRFSPSGRRLFAAFVACCCCFCSGCYRVEHALQCLPLYLHTGSAAVGDVRRQRWLHNEVASGALLLPSLVNALGAEPPLRQVGASGAETAQGTVRRSRYQATELLTAHPNLSSSPRSLEQSGLLPAESYIPFFLRQHTDRRLLRRSGVQGRAEAVRVPAENKNEHRLAQFPNTWAAEQQHREVDWKQVKLDGEQQEDRQAKSTLQSDARLHSTEGWRSHLQRSPNSWTKQLPRQLHKQLPSLLISKQERAVRMASSFNERKKEGRQPQERAKYLHERQTGTAPLPSVEASMTAASLTTPVPTRGPAFAPSAVEQRFPNVFGPWKKASGVISRPRTADVHRRPARSGRPAKFLDSYGSPGSKCCRAGNTGSNSLVGITRVRGESCCAGADAPSPPSRLLSAGAYALRRRLAAVPGDEQYQGKTYSNTSPGDKEPASAPPTPLWRDVRTQQGPGSLGDNTGVPDGRLPDLLEQTLLTDVLKTRGYRRRRRARDQLRSRDFESLWAPRDKPPSAGVGEDTGVALILQNISSAARGEQEEEEGEEEEGAEDRGRLDKHARSPPPPPAAAAYKNGIAGQELFSSDKGSFVGNPRRSSLSEDLTGFSGRDVSSSNLVTVLGPPSEDTALSGFRPGAGDASDYRRESTGISASQNAAWNSSSQANNMTSAAAPSRWAVVEETGSGSSSSVTPTSADKSIDRRERFQGMAALHHLLGASASLLASSARRPGGEKRPHSATNSSKSNSSTADLPTPSQEPADTYSTDPRKRPQPYAGRWQSQSQLQYQQLPPDPTEPGGKYSPSEEPKAEGWPGSLQAAEEQESDLEPILGNRRLAKPLQRRQRIALVLSIIISCVFVVALWNTSIKIRSLYAPSLPFHLFMLGGLTVLLLEYKIAQTVVDIAVATTLLLYDFSLRRKLRREREVAEALQSLREQEERAKAEASAAGDSAVAADGRQQPQENYPWFS